MLHTLSLSVTLLSMLEQLPATFTTRLARQLGVHPRDLYRWRDDGSIIELSRGVFRRADAPPASLPDLLAIAHRVPGAVVCCMTAAAVHDLSDELVTTVQVAVPSRTRPPRITYPPTDAFRFEESTFEIGLSSIEAAPDETVRIYDPARTVVDLMRLRHRFGAPHANQALNRYLDARGGPRRLLDYARTLGVYGPMKAAVDVATAR